MEVYKTWVIRNKEDVHSLESLANTEVRKLEKENDPQTLLAYDQGLTWLLPERFSASEMGPEAVTATLGIITAINEHIIDTTPVQTHESFQEPHSFPFSLCISALKDLETLVEVVAKQYYGDDKKWNFIAVIEAIKMLVRLVLFRNSGYKMLLHGGETPNVENCPDDLSDQHGDGGFPKPRLNHGPNFLMNGHGQNPWKPEGGALSALSRFGENARMISDPVWLRKIQNRHAIMEPQRVLVQRPTLGTLLCKKGVYGALFVIGEMLFITRPLFYVLFIRKYGIRSWIPWFVSLVVDFISVGFITRVARRLKRRKLLWALYLMRDPFFSKYTCQRLASTEKLLEPIPVVGLLTSKIVELVIGAHT